MYGKGLTSWLSFVVCHFPIGILGQVWYLIVSIPDLCTLAYFVICEMVKLVTLFTLDCGTLIISTTKKIFFTFQSNKGH